MIVEPVQGEGGFVVPPDDFLPRLSRLLRELDIPLIADEIQTGLGRSGELFAVSHWGVEPDLVLLAKSLGGGLPLAAVVGRADLMDAPAPGGLGGTFGGNPVACAAALAVLDVIERDDICARSRRVGDIALRAHAGDAGAPRLHRRRARAGRDDGDGAGRTTARAATRRPTSPPRCCARRTRRGLALLRAGLHDNVIRLLMPLTISDDELTPGLDILEQSLEAADHGHQRR